MVLLLMKHSLGCNLNSEFQRLIPVLFDPLTGMKLAKLNDFVELGHKGLYIAQRRKFSYFKRKRECKNHVNSYTQTELSV